MSRSDDDFIPLKFDSAPETLMDGVERTWRRFRREMRHRLHRQAHG